MSIAASTSTKNKLQERQLISIPPLDPKNFQTLIPNRFDTLHLHDESSSNTDRANYRYRLIVMDRSFPPHVTSTSLKSRSQYLQGITHPVAVFLIPAGRESEYLFRTYRGLDDVARSADCARLIAVSFHRDHSYPGGQKVVQAELEVAVQAIAQRGAFMYVGSKEREWYLRKLREDGSKASTSFSIPFMALDGIGKRDVVAEGDSPATGPFIVEEVDVDGGRTVRRLYFRENENVVQTEVFLKEGDGADGGRGIDVLKLAFDYHQHIAAGVLALGGVISPSIPERDVGPAPSERVGCGQGMVIGLGGGALVNFFMEFMPTLNFTVVELDECIVDIAKSHFGFRADSPRVKVVIGDGLAICTKHGASKEGDTEEKSGSEGDIAGAKKDPEDIIFPSNSMQFIVIDVDSKDTSIGMSCPPVPFVSPAYLSQLYDLLGKHGVLVINVSARDPLMLHSVKANAHQVFDSVFVSSTDIETTDEDGRDAAEDLNVVVFCTKNEDHAMATEVGDYSTLLRNYCTANNVTGEEVISELEDCIVGIKKVYVPTKEETDDSLDQSKKLLSKPSKSSRGKKKGNSKKKKGKKK